MAHEAATLARYPVESPVSDTDCLTEPSILTLRDFVYLAYLDDSKRKDTKIQVLAAVMLKDEVFPFVETIMGISAALVPQERIEQFEEFHAWELYGGYGVFDGVEQAKRFRAIRDILLVLREKQIPIVYGAVDPRKLRGTLYASVNSIDVAFRICAEGIETWVGKNDPTQIAMLIADNGDKAVRLALKQSFREIRMQIRPPDYSSGMLRHIHDDMYFGDSKDSIGIQLADLCAYFIGKHLEGDIAADSFYSIIESQIFHSRVFPS